MGRKTNSGETLEANGPIPSRIVAIPEVGCGAGVGGAGRVVASPQPVARFPPVAVQVRPTLRSQVKQAGLLAGAEIVIDAIGGYTGRCLGIIPVDSMTLQPAVRRHPTSQPNAQVPEQLEQPVRVASNPVSHRVA